MLSNYLLETKLHLEKELTWLLGEDILLTFVYLTFLLICAHGLFLYFIEAALDYAGEVNYRVSLYFYTKNSLIAPRSRCLQFRKDFGRVFDFSQWFQKFSFPSFFIFYIWEWDTGFSDHLAYWAPGKRLTCLVVKFRACFTEWETRVAMSYFSVVAREPSRFTDSVGPEAITT